MAVCPIASDRVIAEFEAAYKNDETVMEQRITDINTVNMARLKFEDVTWGLVRASSITPNLFVAVECPSSYKMAPISARAKRDFAHLFS